MIRIVRCISTLLSTTSPIASAGLRMRPNLTERSRSSTRHLASLASRILRDRHMDMLWRASCSGSTSIAAILLSFPRQSDFREMRWTTAAQPTEGDRSELLLWKDMKRPPELRATKVKACLDLRKMGRAGQGEGDDRSTGQLYVFRGSTPLPTSRRISRWPSPLPPGTCSGWQHFHDCQPLCPTSLGNMVYRHSPSSPPGLAPAIGAQDHRSTYEDTCVLRSQLSASVVR